MDDMSSEPYSRVYHKLADEYPDLYDGPDLADYVRLLVAADQSWPTKAKWAGHTSRRALNRLEACGLIEVDGTRYTVKGMDKERAERSDAARYAVNKRWDYARNTDRNTDGTTPRNTETIPSKDEQSKDETSQVNGRGPDAFEVYQQVTGSWPTKPTVISWLSSLVDDYDEPDVCDALVLIAGQDPTRTTLLGRVRDHLASEAHRKNREAEERRERAEAAYQARERERTKDMTPVKLPPFGDVVKGFPS